MAPKGKRKLTLTVDADTVERARKQEINISDLTERLLQSVTIESGALDRIEERKEYLRLLATMDSVIRAYHIEVPVGKVLRTVDEWGDDLESALLYVGGGQFRPTDPNALGLDLSNDNWAWPIEQIERKDTHAYFDSPMRVISNFIEKVSEKKREREIEMHDLRVARSVLEAVLGANKPAPPAPETPGKPEHQAAKQRRGRKVKA